MVPDTVTRMRVTEVPSIEVVLVVAFRDGALDAAPLLAARMAVMALVTQAVDVALRL